MDIMVEVKVQKTNKKMKWVFTRKIGENLFSYLRIYDIMMPPLSWGDVK